jgi:hypothetical protein
MTRWGRVGLGILAFGVVGACGSGTSTGSVRDSLLSAAAGRTAKASTFRFWFLMSAPRPLMAAGVADTSQATIDMTLRRIGLGRQEVREVNGERYITQLLADRGPSPTDPGTVRWVRLGRSSSVAGLPVPKSFVSDLLLLISGQGTIGPPELLADLTSTSAHLSPDGRASARGVPTAHFTGAIPLPAVGQNKTVLPITVDTDRQGRLRRITLVASRTTGPGTLDFFDFGVSVSVTAPPTAASRS